MTCNQALFDPSSDGWCHIGRVYPSCETLYFNGRIRQVEDKPKTNYSVDNEQFSHKLVQGGGVEAHVYTSHFLPHPFSIFLFAFTLKKNVFILYFISSKYGPRLMYLCRIISHPDRMKPSAYASCSILSGCDVTLKRYQFAFQFVSITQHKNLLILHKFYSPAWTHED